MLSLKTIATSAADSDFGGRRFADSKHREPLSYARHLHQQQLRGDDGFLPHFAEKKLDF